jgi:hypothetical protein
MGSGKPATLRRSLVFWRMTFFFLKWKSYVLSKTHSGKNAVTHLIISPWGQHGCCKDRTPIHSSILSVKTQTMRLLASYLFWTHFHLVSYPPNPALCSFPLSRIVGTKAKFHQSQGERVWELCVWGIWDLWPKRPPTQELFWPSTLTVGLEITPHINSEEDQYFSIG